MMIPRMVIRSVALDKLELFVAGILVTISVEEPARRTGSNRPGKPPCLDAHAPGTLNCHIGHVWPAGNYWSQAGTWTAMSKERKNQS